MGPAGERVKRGLNLRKAAPTAVLVLLAIFTTAFAFINYGSIVRVWPLPGAQHLTVVIAAALGLGAAIGGLLVHLFHQNRIPSAPPTPAELRNR